jgi:hypothetical protein
VIQDGDAQASRDELAVKSLDVNRHPSQRGRVRPQHQHVERVPHPRRSWLPARVYRLPAATLSGTTPSDTSAEEASGDKT